MLAQFAGHGGGINIQNLAGLLQIAGVPQSILQILFLISGNGVVEALIGVIFHLGILVAQIEGAIDVAVVHMAVGGAAYDQIFHDVAQLTDIARPGVVFQ